MLPTMTGNLQRPKQRDVEPPRMQIPTYSAPGPSPMSNSSVDLPNNEEPVMPVYSRNINKQDTFQNFESDVNSLHQIPSISNDLGFEQHQR